MNLLLFLLLIYIMEEPQEIMLWAWKHIGSWHEGVDVVKCTDQRQGYKTTKQSISYKYEMVVQCEMTLCKMNCKLC
jgi:hypothetical protein